MSECSTPPTRLAGRVGMFGGGWFVGSLTVVLRLRLLQGGWLCFVELGANGVLMEKLDLEGKGRVLE